MVKQLEKKSKQNPNKKKHRNLIWKRISNRVRKTKEGIFVSIIKRNLEFPKSFPEFKDIKAHEPIKDIKVLKILEMEPILESKPFSKSDLLVTCGIIIFFFIFHKLNSRKNKK